MHYAFPRWWGRYKKYPPPERSGVGYKVFHGSTLVTVIRPSLIGTLTGAPVRPFPTGGSEVVSIQAGVQMPFTIRHPLWESYRDCVSSSQLFTDKNLS